MKKVNIGIDLGGSHVAIGVVTKNGQIIEMFEKDFTVQEKLDLINVSIEYIDKIIKKIKNIYEFDKIGIGMAGAISNGIVVKSVNLNIENFNIKKVLEEKTKLVVHVKNDAKCAAIAEYKYGGLTKFKNILFLTLGTGIGGAYIYNGKLMEGTIFEGMEIGHTIIKAGGIKCNCGKFGCFEKYGSILVFKNRIIERLNLNYDISGPDLRKEIALNEEKIQDIKKEYINDLGLGISNLVNILEPDVVVIGGGFARYDYMLLNDLKQLLSSSNLLFNQRNDLIIKVAKLGNDAGIIGASLLK